MEFSSIECADKVVLRRGYLKKLPNKSKFGSSFKRWERRWFVFCTVNGSPCLEYYESEDNFLRKEQPINLIWLTTTQYVIQALADEKHENMFNIGMTERILNLIAPTRDEMEAWLKTLEWNLGKLGVIDTAEDRYAAFPGAPNPSEEQTFGATDKSWMEPVKDLPQPAAQKPGFEAPLKGDQPTHVSLPSTEVNGGNSHVFEDIGEAKAKAMREFEVVESQRQALERKDFEDVSEAKAKAKREFEARVSSPDSGFEDVAAAKERAKMEASKSSSDGFTGFEDITAIKAAAQARTVSECSSGSDQVFEDIDSAKKQAQARMASFGSESDAKSKPLAPPRSVPVPAPRGSAVPPPRKESVDEIDLIKAQNKRNEMQQKSLLTNPMRDPKSPLPPIPDEDLKKTKSALEPPDKPAAAMEKSPRSRRHLEKLVGNSRADENLYEPPNPGGLPPDFPSLPPPPPPTHPGMRRYSDSSGPVDMYGAVWNENVPPALPEKKQHSFERQDSRSVRLAENEGSIPRRSSGSSQSSISSPPPLPENHPTFSSLQRANTAPQPFGAPPLQAAGTFDPDAIKNLMESSTEYNKRLLQEARERGLTAQTQATVAGGPSFLRAHSVKGVMTSPGAAVSLKEREVEQLRQEISHVGGVQVALRKKDCYQTLAVIDYMDSVWVVGWNQKASPFLHNAFHIGDRVMSINGQDVIDAENAHKIIKHSSCDHRVEFVVQRTPYASVYAIKRSAEGESLGIKREGGTAEIYEVVQGGLAGRHGLPMQACSLDGTTPCHWVLTEVNNRPLNLFFKDKEIEHRLNAVGRDISIMVQPYDFIFALKKLFKKSVKNYKDFIVQ